MSNSITLRGTPQEVGQRYLATVGIDLVEEGLQLDWIVRTVTEWCAGNHEDVALWLVEGVVHRLVAVLRPRAAGAYQVTYLV
jgi:hypothetical protein